MRKERTIRSTKGKGRKPATTIKLAPGFSLRKESAIGLREYIICFRDQYKKEYETAIKKQKNKPRLFIFIPFDVAIANISSDQTLYKNRNSSEGGTRSKEEMSASEMENLKKSFQKIILMLIQHLELAKYFSETLRSKKAKKEYLYLKNLCKSFAYEYVRLSKSERRGLRKKKSKKIIREYFNLSYVFRHQATFFQDKAADSKALSQRDAFVKLYAVNLCHYGNNVINDDARKKQQKESQSIQESTRQTQRIVDFLGDTFADSGNLGEYLQRNSTFLARCFGITEQIIKEDFLENSESRIPAIDVYGKIETELDTSPIEESYKKLKDVRLALTLHDKLITDLEKDIPGRDTAKSLQEEVVVLKRGIAKKEWGILLKAFAKDLRTSKPQKLKKSYEDNYNSLLSSLKKQTTQYEQWPEVINLLAQTWRKMNSFQLLGKPVSSCQKINDIIQRVINWALLAPQDSEHLNNLCEALYFAVPVLFREDAFEILFTNFDKLDTTHQLLLIKVALDSKYRDEKRNKKIVDMLAKCRAPEEDSKIDELHFKYKSENVSHILTFSSLAEQYNKSIHNLDNTWLTVFTWFSRNNGHLYDIKSQEEKVKKIRAKRIRLDETIKNVQLPENIPSDQTKETLKLEKTAELSYQKIEALNASYDKDEELKTFIMRCSQEVFKESQRYQKKTTSQILDALDQDKKTVEKEKLNERDWDKLKEILEERRVARRMKKRMAVIRNNPKLRIFYATLITKINQRFLGYNTVTSGFVQPRHGPTAKAGLIGNGVSTLVKAAPMVGSTLSAITETVTATVTFAGNVYLCKLSNRLSKLAFSQDQFSIFVQQVALALLDEVERGHKGDEYLLKIDGTAMVEAIHKDDIEKYATRVTELFFRYLESKSNPDMPFEINCLDENFIRGFVDGLRSPIEKVSVYSHTMAADDNFWFTPKIKVSDSKYKSKVRVDDYFYGKKTILADNVANIETETDENSVELEDLDKKNKGPVNIKKGNGKIKSEESKNITPVEQYDMDTRQQTQRHNKEIKALQQENAKLKKEVIELKQQVEEKGQINEEVTGLKNQVKELSDIIKNLMKNEKKVQGNVAYKGLESVQALLSPEDASTASTEIQSELKKPEDECEETEEKETKQSENEDETEEVEKNPKGLNDSEGKKVKATQVSGKPEEESSNITQKKSDVTDENADPNVMRVIDPEEQPSLKKEAKELPYASASKSNIKPDTKGKTKVKGMDENPTNSSKEQDKELIAKKGLIRDLAKLSKLQKEFCRSNQIIFDLVTKNENIIREFGTRNRDWLAEMVSDSEITYYRENVERYISTIKECMEPLAKNKIFASLSKVFKVELHILSCSNEGKLNAEIENLQKLTDPHYILFSDSSTKKWKLYYVTNESQDEIEISKIDSLNNILKNKKLFDEMEKKQIRELLSIHYSEMYYDVEHLPQLLSLLSHEIVGQNNSQFTQWLEHLLLNTIHSKFLSEFYKNLYNVFGKDPVPFTLRVASRSDYERWKKDKTINSRTYVLVKEEDDAWTLRYFYDKDHSPTRIHLKDVKVEGVQESDDLESMLDKNTKVELIQNDQRVLEAIGSYHERLYGIFKQIIFTPLQAFEEMTDKFFAPKEFKDREKFNQLVNGYPNPITHLTTRMQQTFVEMKKRCEQAGLSQEAESISKILSYLEVCVSKFNQQSEHLYPNSDVRRISDYLTCYHRVTMFKASRESDSYVQEESEESQDTQYTSEQTA